jgi:hypothetical protein
METQKRPVPNILYRIPPIWGWKLGDRVELQRPKVMM